MYLRVDVHHFTWPGRLRQLDRRSEKPAKQPTAAAAKTAQRCMFITCLCVAFASSMHQHQRLQGHDPEVSLVRDGNRRMHPNIMITLADAPRFFCIFLFQTNKSSGADVGRIARLFRTNTCSLGGRTPSSKNEANWKPPRDES